MATVFALPGFDMAPEQVAEFFDHVFVPGNDIVPLVLSIPESNDNLTLPGVLTPAYLAKLAPAVEQLDDYLTAQAGEKIVISAQWGSIIVSLWLHDKGPTSAINPAEIEFIVASNPVRKLGGAMHDPSYEIPDATPFTVNDVALQYDGWADWPENLPQTSSEVGVINAMLSMTSNAQAYIGASLSNPNKLVTTTGNLTHTLLPQYPLPILLANPIPGTGFPDLNNPILAAADKVLRPLIEAIYDRIIGSLPAPNYPPPVITPPIEVPEGQPPGTPTQNTAPCLNPNHFYVKDGGIRPQPWMQQRIVASGSVGDKAGSYDSTSSGSSLSGLNLQGLFGNFFTTLGNAISVDSLASGIGGGLIAPIGNLLGLNGSLGGLLGGVSASNPNSPAAANKNDLLQTLVVRWTNITPIDQWVYGLITRGGSRVTLQCRSRGYLVVSSGYNEGLTPGPLEIASVFGCGADVGLGGVLSIGTSFAIMEERMNACTIPLAPERCGWHRLPPGKTFTGAVQVRFVSEYWENGQIDGGDGETESSYDAGELRLDLIALPALGE